MLKSRGLESLEMVSMSSLPLQLGLCGVRPHFRVIVLSMSCVCDLEVTDCPQTLMPIFSIFLHGASVIPKPASLCFRSSPLDHLEVPRGRTASPSGSVHRELSLRGMRTLYYCFAGCCGCTKQTGSPNLGESKLHSFTLSRCVVSWLSAFPCPHKNLSRNPLHRCCTMGAFMTGLAPATLG